MESRAEPRISTITEAYQGVLGGVQPVRHTFDRVLTVVQSFVAGELLYVPPNSDNDLCTCSYIQSTDVNWI